MPSPERRRSGAFGWLLSHELRELVASRSYWLLLVVVCLLVGHAFITSVEIYAEASGAGGGPAALSQGLSPLEGFVVPTLGAYDIAATLLFPFVVIRLIASEKQTGSLALSLQAPVSFTAVIMAKTVALALGWLVALVPGLTALLLWRVGGGHLYAPETLTVLLGHVLRGLLTIGIAAAAAALAASAASGAIVALTITLGTWALDYVAAARGGWIAAVAAYTPTSMLKVFERGELRVSTALVLCVLTATGLAVAAIWMREGLDARRRALRLAVAAAVAVLGCAGLSRIRVSRDVSEDRRNSFTRADEAALSRIREPLRVTAYLAPEDPRLVDLERGVLAKLRRTMPDVSVTYSSTGRTGLFEKPNEHYGEIWYDLGGRREMNRSSTEPIVLETIYALGGVKPPEARDEPSYPGYPVQMKGTAAGWVYFALWPSCIAAAWWRMRRPRIGRRQSAMT